ncbi:hypothetical protein [Methanobacterium aggregans]|uniref:hypothetical protein n=1 Tax=Methanobacterium aggregans TaxID=1615586 RepID=UPI001AE0F198|nr:hypothetical protein [Methanobacterium aggregans]MBP2046226.1 acyl carrier protein [Methanobacterium aggregans]
METEQKVRDLIIETLEKKELSKKQILNEVSARTNREISSKALNENIMHLLREEKVEIVGYDFNIYEGKKRIQSIRSDGVVFSLVKRDIINMNLLLKKFGSDIPEDSMEACYQIKRAMNQKLQTMNDPNLNLNRFFNKTYLFLNSQDEVHRRKLISKLAFVLSNEEGSDEMFKQMLHLIMS